MIIVYNPPDGSPVEHFIFNGIKKDLHSVGQLKQYSEAEWEELKKTFWFLKQVTKEEADEILAKSKDIKCEKCEITFKPELKAALKAHMELH